MWKRIWTDPVWSKVISAAIIAVAAAAGTYLLDWWPIIGSFFGNLFALACASSPVPNWLLALLSLWALPVVIFIGALLWRTVRPPKLEGAPWQTYTEDTFFGLRWRWDYGGGRLSDLATFCPHCDYQVFPANASAYTVIDRIAFYCDSCGAELGEFDESWNALENKVRRFVQQKLRNRTWSTPNAA